MSVSPSRSATATTSPVRAARATSAPPRATPARISLDVPSGVRAAGYPQPLSLTISSGDRHLRGDVVLNDHLPSTYEVYGYSSLDVWKSGGWKPASRQPNHEVGGGSYVYHLGTLDLPPGDRAHYRLRLTFHENAGGGDGDRGIVSDPEPWPLAAHIGGLETKATMRVASVAVTKITPSTGCDVDDASSNNTCTLAVTLRNFSDQAFPVWLDGFACHPAGCQWYDPGHPVDVVEIRTAAGWTTVDFTSSRSDTTYSPASLGTLPARASTTVAVRVTLGDGTPTDKNDIADGRLLLQPVADSAGHHRVADCGDVRYASRGAYVGGSHKFECHDY